MSNPSPHNRASAGKPRRHRCRKRNGLYPRWRGIELCAVRFSNQSARELPDTTNGLAASAPLHAALFRSVQRQSGNSSLFSATFPTRRLYSNSLCSWACPQHATDQQPSKTYSSQHTAVQRPSCAGANPTNRRSTAFFTPIGPNTPPDNSLMRVFFSQHARQRSTAYPVFTVPTTPPVNSLGRKTCFPTHHRSTARMRRRNPPRRPFTAQNFQ